MKFQPLGDRVLVRALKKDEVTKSGIVLPDTVKEKPQEGEIIAVGSGKYIDGTLKPLEVKVGQKVMFTKYGPTEIKIDGEELLVLNESDILGIVE
ncbi:MAG: co-chaperone GroES [Patescibacteria group bacterium]|jgi:chaperonin GroES